jgi:hypothetical protein
LTGLEFGSVAGCGGTGVSVIWIPNEPGEVLAVAVKRQVKATFVLAVCQPPWPLFRDLSHQYRVPVPVRVPWVAAEVA